MLVVQLVVERWWTSLVIQNSRATPWHKTTAARIWSKAVGTATGKAIGKALSKATGKAAGK